MSNRTNPSNFIKTSFDKVYEYDTVGKPMTPSYWDKKGVTYKKVTEIHMSAGGGIGGSYWHEYVERIDLEDLVNRDCLVTKTWNGKTIALNLKYMVKARQLTIASAVLHSQNYNYPKGAYTYNWLVEDGHKIRLEDEYGEYK